METVEVGLGQKSYRITVEASVLGRTGEIIKGNLGPVDGAVITDENVDELYGEELFDSLKKSGLDFAKLVVKPGEGSKSPEVAKQLYEKLAKKGLHRDSVIVAFGGGVVGDLAGFVGSTFLRGLRVVQVPTTLLAQVDSSVGGKTAVNLPQGKNLVGSFHQPEAVVIDPEVLSTLSAEDTRSGLGEVLKYGLIRDRSFFSQVVESSKVFDNLEDHEELEGIIARCCKIKAEVVEDDELDRGVRRILNFGHTLGHGIEAASGYGGMKHGEAVIWGMIGESWISRDRGYLDKAVFSNLVEALTDFNLPSLPTDLSKEQLLDYVGRDKKVKQGTINSVLIQDQPGKVVVEEVSEKEITDAWNFLRDLEVER
jgi:3-dehydroquinate synthase